MLVLNESCLTVGELGWSAGQGLGIHAGPWDPRLISDPSLVLGATGRRRAAPQPLTATVIHLFPGVWISLARHVP